MGHIGQSECLYTSVRPVRVTDGGPHGARPSGFGYSHENNLSLELGSQVGLHLGAAVLPRRLQAVERSGLDPHRASFRESPITAGGAGADVTTNCSFCIVAR